MIAAPYQLDSLLLGKLDPSQTWPTASPKRRRSAGNVLPTDGNATHNKRGRTCCFGTQ
jgi:hypothetical protein